VGKRDGLEAAARVGLRLSHPTGATRAAWRGISRRAVVCTRRRHLQLSCEAPMGVGADGHHGGGRFAWRRPTLEASMGGARRGALGRPPCWRV
jgi:hypothetical protein